MITVFFISILFLQIYYFSFTFQVSLSLSCYTVRRLQLTWGHIAEVAASQHFINASTAAKIHKYLSREVRQQFWQYAR